MHKQHMTDARAYDVACKLSRCTDWQQFKQRTDVLDRRYDDASLIRVTAFIDAITKSIEYLTVVTIQ